MEFIEYSLALIVVYLLWKKPEKERLAFGLFMVCFLMNAALFIMATAAGWLPNITL